MTEIHPANKKPLPPQLQRIARLVKLMDSQFRIPGTNFSFGIDPLLNLIPGLGWGIDFGISFYLFFAMIRNGASGKSVSRMLLNIGIDSLVGAIPVVGNIFDFAFKANRRNFKIAIEHFEAGKHQGSGWEIWVPILVFFLFILSLIAVCSYYAIQLLVNIFQIFSP
jgi:Domain of unknown function (DUF4112)